MSIRDGDTIGGIGYGRDIFPSESYYHEEVGTLGDGGSSYLGDSYRYYGGAPVSPGFNPSDRLLQAAKPDPYLPILQEPMGYGFAEKNFSSSLDSVSNYRYQPAPHDEEKYYPDSMLNDTRVDAQYERFGNMGDMSGMWESAGLPEWLKPSPMEIGLLLVLLIIVLVVSLISKSRKIEKLKRKKRDLKLLLAARGTTSNTSVNASKAS